MSPSPMRDPTCIRVRTFGSSSVSSPLSSSTRVPLVLAKSVIQIWSSTNSIRAWFRETVPVWSGTANAMSPVCCGAGLRPRINEEGTLRVRLEPSSKKRKVWGFSGGVTGTEAVCCSTVVRTGYIGFSEGMGTGETCFAVGMGTGLDTSATVLGRGTGGVGCIRGMGTGGICLDTTGCSSNASTR